MKGFLNRMWNAIFPPPPVDRSCGVEVDHVAALSEVYSAADNMRAVLSEVLQQNDRIREGKKGK